MRVVEVLIPSAGVDEHSVALTASVILRLLLAPLLGLGDILGFGPHRSVFRVDEADPKAIAEFRSDAFFLSHNSSLDDIHVFPGLEGTACRQIPRGTILLCN